MTSMRSHPNLPVSVKVWLVVKAWYLLFSLERAMQQSAFFDLYQNVRKRQPARGCTEPQYSHVALCAAVDLACALYFKPVLCLQRSAATTLLMRSYGWHAEMVIGVQIQPFKSHAWVEFAGQIVNDKPYMHEIYQVLDRC